MSDTESRREANPCVECGQVMTPSEWNDRHVSWPEDSFPTGDYHADCCPKCVELEAKYGASDER